MLADQVGGQPTTLAHRGRLCVNPMDDAELAHRMTHTIGLITLLSSQSIVLVESRLVPVLHRDLLLTEEEVPIVDLLHFQVLFRFLMAVLLQKLPECQLGHNFLHPFLLASQEHPSGPIPTDIGARAQTGQSGLLLPLNLLLLPLNLLLLLQLGGRGKLLVAVVLVAQIESSSGIIARREQLAVLLLADGELEGLEVGQLFGLELDPATLILLLDEKRVLLLQVVLLLLRIFQVHAPIAAPSVILVLVMIVVILTLVALVLRVRDGKLDLILARSPLIAPIGLPGCGISASFWPKVVPPYGQKFVLVKRPVGVAA